MSSRSRRAVVGLATVALVGTIVNYSPSPSIAAGRAEGISEAAAIPGFTLVATGDVLVHPALTDQATRDGHGKRDYRPIFAGVKPVVSGAGLAICHLEVPLAPADGPFKGYPAFSAPPEIAAALKDTGYDGCSTASNHTLDMGEAGVARTLDTLDTAGIKHAGSARNAEEAANPLIFEVAGAKMGHVSYTFGFNGRQLPPGKPWLANTLKAEDVIAAAKAAKAAGAEVVVASLHWGTEFVPEPSAEQRRIAQKLLADPSIDLIIGHHAHVVQPFEKINGKWVAYGLGNHIARHFEPKGVTEEGALARFHFSRHASGWTVDRAEYVPTLIDLGPPIRLLDLSRPGAVSEARRAQALERTDQIVFSRGAADQGLIRVAEAEQEGRSVRRRCPLGFEPNVTGGPIPITWAPRNKLITSDPLEDMRPHPRRHLRDQHVGFK